MRNFNLDDFKKWIREQDKQEQSKNSLNKGDFIQSKIPFKKLVNRINEENGNRKSICKEFYTEGGTIVGFEDSNIIVEVKTGTFSINKIYVELA